MSNTKAAASPSTTRRRATLLHGVSLGALVAASGLPATAQAAAIHSLNQALALAGRATAQAAIAPSAAISASQQGAIGAQSVARAATRLRSLAESLATAAAVSSPTGPKVIDGTGPGTGLQIIPGTIAGGATWTGAALPTSAATATGVTVTVAQTKPLARLTWQSFNVGRHTTLAFNQSAGGTLASSWVVINSVQDPTANPAQILGAITAPGKVYVLDRNGIAFSAGSTVNVGSLVAATADIAAAQFSTTASGVTSFNLYGTQTASVSKLTKITSYYQPTFINGSASGITVAAGATIATATPTGTDGGGYVMLLGGNVTNAGMITTPQGQTVLAAGSDFTLRQGSGPISTTLGSEVASTNTPINYNSGLPSATAAFSTFPTGAVTNTGIVTADRGDITLVGHRLTQSGVLLSTTTVDTRGTIHLLTPTDGSDPTSTVSLSPGSVTEILPEDLGQTALDSQRAANIAASLAANALRANPQAASAINPQLNTLNFLPDQLGESRVELSTGGSIDVGAGASVLAQGGQIAVGGGASVLVEAGASLDVSGTTSALIPASAYSLLVNSQPFQLRDSAANRTGPLKGVNVFIDPRTLLEVASGAYAGNIYTGGGLLEVGGYLGLVPHGIGEWTAIGGQVTLQAAQTLLTGTGKTLTPVTTPGTITTQAGADINLQGGAVTYQAGQVQQTYVQSTDGRIFDINSAPGNLVYTGIYTGQTVAHPRWGVTDTYTNPLLTPASVMEPGYTVGRDAGTLTINAGSASLMGSVDAGVTPGALQQGPRPAAVTDPYLLAQTVVPEAGALLFGNYIGGTLQPATLDTNIVFQATQGAPLPPPSTSGTSSAGTTATPAPGIAVIDAPQLNADGFATISVTTAGNILVASPIQVADGGSVSLTGARTTISANITARGGTISVSDQTSLGPVAPYFTGITLSPGATLDTRGLWTNAVLDPAHLAGLGHANGGTVTLAASRGVTLSAGATIDVSSGGAILAGGKTLSGHGGSLSITADTPLLASLTGRHLDPVTLDSTFIGYASGGGGTFSLTAPELQIGAGPPGPFITVSVPTTIFSTGFAKYAINGTALLSVLPGTQITATQPIYEPGQGLGLPTGSDPASAYILALPPLYTPVKSTDSLSQRPGASISLSASAGPGAPLPGQGGPITIGAGAGITVDPGQTITVAGYGQVSVLGTLTAHGGTVHVTNTSFDIDQATTIGNLNASDFQSGVSVWLGAASVIDVSGISVVQTDPAGRRFGLATAGGTITLGSAGAATPSPVQVIQRPGSILDADGAQATVDVVQGTQALSAAAPSATTPITLAGNGGTIAAESINGIALDGTVTARSGGQGASGGALSITLDANNLAAFNNIPTYVYQPRQILITQGTVTGQPDPTLQPGEPAPASTYGTARLSQQEIDLGGFSAVSLSAQGAAIVFEGNVDLHTDRSLTLATGIIGASTPNETIHLAAPYVDLIGETTGPTTQPAPPAFPSFGSLTITADLIDQSNAVFLGGSAVISPGRSILSGPPPMMIGPPVIGVSTTAFGFGQTTLDSTGDIRLLGTTDRTLRQGELLSIGNITLQAAQIIPASNQAATILAGYLPGHSQTQPASQNGTILIRTAPGGAAAQLPYSIGGALTFEAGTIVQGGVIRAPEGTITFTDGSVSASVAFPSHVTFAPASITSVSLAGQTVPFGGTVDGVTYATPGGAVLPAQPAITVQSQAIDVETGATIDLRGGGTLSGAGFVFGRGGSADVLTTPLLDITGAAAVANAQAAVAAIAPVRTGDPVYAVLPGYAASYAPPTGAGDAGYSTPAIGQQITVGANTAGLAAGTYTLLPAYYALLPGGYRVELTSGALPAGTTQDQGNFTTAAPVTLSIANTAISAPVPTVALLSSGAGVRQLSQYDEESYNTFAAASATAFGAPRPFLPQDAKTLVLSYPGVIGTGTQLSFAPDALLKAPAPGGYGATLEITTPSTIAIVGPGDPIITNLEVAIQASTLDALDIPRLVIGGTLSSSTSSPQTMNVNAAAASVTILPHASVTAGDILLTATDTGSIRVYGGGTLSTIGAGPAAYDTATSGYHFNTDNGAASYPVVSVSNGRVTFTPTLDPATGAAISIGDGSALLAGGSLDLVAPLGTVVGIGRARLGAAQAAISVAAVNFGSQALLDADASLLPTGLSLTPDSFAALLAGDPAAGIPAIGALTLTATQEVNLLGSAALDAGTTNLVLNTPAIYGVGTATDAVSITAPRVTWNGVAGQDIVGFTGLPTAVSALPGGRIATPKGQATGNLSINAGTIVLGYGPQTQPNPQLQLDRLIEGFSSVTLNATAEITANNQSSLSVTALPIPFGQTATSGNLTLATPLVTTDSASILKLSAGGTISLTSNGAAPASTAAISSLGGALDITANDIAIATAIALPAGRVTATAQDSLDLSPTAAIDLAGRAVHILDQTRFAPGGTLAFESTTGTIALDAGARIDVSSPGAAAGSISFNALAGEVIESATLLGAAVSGQAGGSLSIIAGTLATATQAANLAPGASALDEINAGLNTGGFTASRSFEIGTDIGPNASGGGTATTDLTVGNDAAGHALLAAQTISLTADLGSIDVTGLIDASGPGPGSILLAARQNLTLASTASLDAHATTTAVDSNLQPIDAENRAHVTLTATTGSLTLAGGSIDLSYPGAAMDPQGQLVLNAPRIGGRNVAIDASAPITVTGADSIALYAWRTYTPTDPNGTIAQTAAGQPAPASGQIVTLDRINADSTAFINAASANPGLATRLAGLSTYGAQFHVRPGVEIDSSAASSGDLTISGDLNLATLRYSDVGYGLAVTPGQRGSGEPGAILFRASNDLTVNGSVTDGFAAPPDALPANYIKADAGWVYVTNNFAGGAEPLSADLLLPASVSVTVHGSQLTTSSVELGVGTVFDNTRPVSLNYPIQISTTPVNPNVVIPFEARIAIGNPLVVPQGGFVTTARLTVPNGGNGGTVIPAGTFLPGGFIIPGNSRFAAGTVFPIPVQVANGTMVPAGTLLSIFGAPVALGKATAALPVNAFIPSNTTPVFQTTKGDPISTLELRAVTKDADGHARQGLLYALAAMLPAGSQSWSLDFAAGANLASADVNAVLPRSVLDGGALATQSNTPYQAPGSLLLDDQHYLTSSSDVTAVAPAFSVIRTGTGDLTLTAGGNFDQSSLYGIYTAGTQDPLPGGDAANAPYDSHRAGYDNGKFILPKGTKNPFNRLVGVYQAYFPNNGGDVSLAAQGSLTGDLYGGSSTVSGVNLLPSDEVGNWLWRQGSTALGQPTAWWINFGALAVAYGAGDNSGYYGFTQPVQLVGFQGIGALGGGNVTVSAGLDAGQQTDRTGIGTVPQSRGEGLVIAVGGTGRVVSTNGTLSTVETGGGHLTLRIGGTLNPLDATAYGVPDTSSGYSTGVNGSLIDLCGTIDVTAGAIGREDAIYSSAPPLNDPRPADPFTAAFAANGGIDLVPGDATISITTNRDLVIDGAGDPGRVTEQNLARVTPVPAGTGNGPSVASGFSLWTPETAIALFSSGGTVDPVAAPDIDGSKSINNGAATDGRILYPSQLSVTAATGDIAYGLQSGQNPISLEVAPSANEQVAFLAGTSIFANGMAIDLSGADPAGLSTPANPAFTLLRTGKTDILPGLGTVQNADALFALEADTPTTSYLSTPSAAQPALFYAATGDIVDFITGETLTFAAAANEALPQWYLAAKPVRIIAGRDIVSSGTRPSVGLSALQQNQQRTGFEGASTLIETASGNLFLNTAAQSVSVVSAGRDILSGYFYVGGPGLLEVDAGRTLDQVGFATTSSTGGVVQDLAYGSIKSFGSLLTGAPVSLTGGAGLSINAGLGAGADYTAFANLYLNPANQADPALQITDPANKGRVQQTYAAQLLAFLQQDYAYAGTQADALAFFLNPARVPATSQDAFLRNIFYAELLASGQQYNDPASRFHLSYTRGRQAIDALLPGQANAVTTNGLPAGYSGAVTMASGTVTGLFEVDARGNPILDAKGNPVPVLLDAGVATERGGDIQILAPGGQIVLGTSGGAAPGGGTGLITNGAGNIDVFSLGSVLLGKSRIFTNAGGNIQIWSASGDINAGIGARTTIVFNPPVISFDSTGGIVEVPAIPSSGAGIATEQPFPSIPAGNIDLTAPLGTIDAGEAGVRSSGNLNLAAARLANTAGFSAGGKTSGNSGPATVSLGAVEAAGAAAGAGQQAAQNLAGTHTQDQLPSIIEVDVLSVSGESDEQKRKKRGG